MARAFSDIAHDTFERKLVLQRPPQSENDEAIADSRGFPLENYVPLDESNPIPCRFIVQSPREVTINNQQRTATPYLFTIPKFYRSGTALKPVDFSMGYRAKVLADEEYPELLVHVISGANGDVGTALIFTAVRTDELNT